ncbi:Ntc20p NDAI_0C05570 [Naumovozyma dairenensis CBS 421]|uniref:Uncharacterized protein n=1 Tax=Naumovozyma dairenensis (strain ATCC 10597 / BCRC 20456 / CBS 421 / NBRC 0211 / NRRL Y-12639) TaxID=1071378 RepID=G0W8V5_NAUDC|nr:hypothetical protein NDAI_0C05570 [Naumovozyma dairenensis CBS 421]CCD24216.1 hypothetical protein NDAI_0C05570 [Naumovozyma dairenensis CBS 421]
MSYIEKQTESRKRRLEQLQAKLKKVPHHTNEKQTSIPVDDSLHNVTGKEAPNATKSIEKPTMEEDGVTYEALPKDQDNILNEVKRDAIMIASKLESPDEKNDSFLHRHEVEKVSATKDLKLKLRDQLEILDQRTNASLKRILRERLMKEGQT